MSDELNSIYADIEEISNNIEIKNLSKELSDAHQKIDSLNNELFETKQQLQLVTDEKDRLENNIATLYQTALREIARKDKELTELRSKAIDQPFRR